jgi:hypothetical protein
MIPNLLWRCPLCLVNESLTQKRGLFRPWTVTCSECKTIWEVKRVVGKDFRMKVISNPTYQEEIGLELPLADWYARMKKTVSLQPIDDPDLNLSEGERLYLASRRIVLNALANDKIFFAEKVLEDGTEEIVAKRVGNGRIFLTNQRFVWQGEDGKTQDFSLQRINSFYTMANIAAALMHGTSLYIMRFPEDKMLKWVTYFGHVAEEVKATTGHQIITSNF